MIIFAVHDGLAHGTSISLDNAPQVGKLMGHYQQSTGQQFNSSGGNAAYVKLAQIASQKAGINIPPALLMKL